MTESSANLRASALADAEEEGIQEGLPRMQKDASAVCEACGLFHFELGHNSRRAFHPFEEISFLAACEFFKYARAHVCVRCRYANYFAE